MIDPGWFLLPLLLLRAGFEVVRHRSINNPAETEVFLSGLAHRSAPRTAVPQRMSFLHHLLPQVRAVLEEDHLRKSTTR